LQVRWRIPDLVVHCLLSAQEHDSVLSLTRGSDIASPFQFHDFFPNLSKSFPIDSIHDERQLIVIEPTVNPEISCSRLFPHSCHFSDTLDSNFIGRMIRCRDQNFNSNIRSDWGALAAANQGTVQCNVACEAALCAFHAVIPMEYYWQP
jgi:hypothetical protein